MERQPKCRALLRKNGGWAVWQILALLGQPLQALQTGTRPSASDPSDYPSLTFVNAPRGTSGQPFAGMAALVPLS